MINGWFIPWFIAFYHPPSRSSNDCGLLPGRIRSVTWTAPSSPASSALAQGNHWEIMVFSHFKLKNAKICVILWNKKHRKTRNQHLNQHLHDTNEVSTCHQNGIGTSNTSGILQHILNADRRCLSLQKWRAWRPDLPNMPMENPNWPFWRSKKWAPFYVPFAKRNNHVDDVEGRTPPSEMIMIPTSAIESYSYSQDSYISYPLAN